MTAIPLADTDGNPDTTADPDWLPLINTPSHPEYPAGHPSQNGAAATVLLSYFGDAQTFTLTTAGQPNRTYTSIAQARSDGNNARVWGGMHYPSTVEISDAVGRSDRQLRQSELDATAPGSRGQVTRRREANLHDAGLPVRAALSRCGVSNATGRRGVKAPGFPPP